MTNLAKFSLLQGTSNSNMERQDFPAFPLIVKRVSIRTIYIKARHKPNSTFKQQQTETEEMNTFRIHQLGFFFARGQVHSVVQPRWNPLPRPDRLPLASCMERVGLWKFTKTWDKRLNLGTTSNQRSEVKAKRARNVGVRTIRIRIGLRIPDAVLATLN